MRAPLLLLALLALPASAAEPPAAAAPGAAAAPSLPAIPEGKTRLIFIRESTAISMLAGAQVRIGGDKLGTIGNGGAAAFDVAPGDMKVHVSNSLDLFGGTVRATLAAAAGETHYIAISPYGVGLFRMPPHPEAPLGGDVTVCNNNWCVHELSEAEALPLLERVAVAPPGN